MKTLDLAEEKKGIKREIITSPDFLSKAIKDPLFDNAVVGSGSIFNVKTKTVFLYEQSLQPGTLFSCQSLGRKIIENALTASGRRRYPGSSDWDRNSLLPPPQYCFPANGNFVYLDLKSAYWQIYQRMPLFPHRGRNRFHHAPPFLRDFLPDDLRDYKLIRNSIGGVWRSSVATRIKNFSLERKTTIFPTTSFSSWQFLQGFLHTIAGIAIKMGAYYVNSDGYIFRQESGWEDFIEFLEDNGLEWEIKTSGEGFIAGIGSYSIGGLQTKRINKGTKIDKVACIDPSVLGLRRSNFL